MSNFSIYVTICDSKYSQPLKATIGCLQGVLLAEVNPQKGLLQDFPWRKLGSNAKVLHLLYTVTVISQDLTQQPSGYELLFFILLCNCEFD